MEDMEMIEEYLCWEFFLESYYVDTEYICSGCDRVIRMDVESQQMFCDLCGEIESEEAQEALQAGLSGNGGILRLIAVDAG